MKNKIYDVLKPIALVWLPALGTLYFAIAHVWGFPDADQVVGSITALDAFLGAALHISSWNYKSSDVRKTVVSDGNLVVDRSDPARDKFSLEVTTPISEIYTKSSITLNVMPEASRG